MIRPRMRAACMFSLMLLVLPFRETFAAETRRPVLITVDDLPIAATSLHPRAEDRERITKRMLDAFAKHGIKAVGLVTWQRVQSPSDEALLEQWLKAGHELGNHSYAHLDYTTTGVEAYLADIERARVELDRLLARNQRPPHRFFRFPFLREGDTEEKLEAMRAYLDRNRLRNLHVTVDDQDWSFEKPYVEALRAKDTKGASLIAADYHAMLRAAFRHSERRGDKLFGRMVPDIVLLHANQIGAEQWDQLFTWLTESGHRFATADEVLADPALSTPQALLAPYGFGLWDRIRAERMRAEAEKAAGAILAAQVKAWNAGDLEAFCSAYEPDATFISPSGLTRGRDAILARYRAKYATKAKMGTLDFEIIEVRLADGIEVSIFGDAVPSAIHGASIILRWKLSYAGQAPASGLSMVTMKRHRDTWRVAQDASM